jgi:hypothetical protein
MRKRRLTLPPHKVWKLGPLQVRWSRRSGHAELTRELDISFGEWLNVAVLVQRAERFKDVG